MQSDVFLQERGIGRFHADTETEKAQLAEGEVTRPQRPRLMGPQVEERGRCSKLEEGRKGLSPATSTALPTL